jgi:zinc/manganese transport system permease protein
MCLVLTGIHAYLGVHVLAREVVFVDIALAQIAASARRRRSCLVTRWTPGNRMPRDRCHDVGALVLALTRSRRHHVSQEA